MDRPADTAMPSPWYLLLLIPFVAILWVPFYASATPDWRGIPFFYWYQFLWVFISAAITALVYFVTRERSTESTAEDIDAALDRESI
jgi:hypothetical protein